MKKSELRKIIKEEIISIFEDAKDDMRINDIVRKAAGDERAMVKLATTMANRITDGLKAVRRAQAAEKIIGKGDVSKVFQDKAKSLGMTTKENPKRSEGKGYIYLPTWSAVNLWQYEITGQLSDGYWENARPYNHWEHWADLEVKRGSPEVKSGRYFPKTGYNLSALLPVVGDRMLNLGRFGKATGKLIRAGDSSGTEDLPETYDEYLKSKSSYVKRLNKKDVAKYYKTSYSKSELNSDLKYIKKAMNSVK